MLELRDFMPINYLKKEPFTGSFSGMRFRMEKGQEEEETFLAVTAWPEPYSYDATPEERKSRERFSFDADGIAQGVKWLNEEYGKRYGGRGRPSSGTDGSGQSGETMREQ